MTVHIVVPVHNRKHMTKDFLKSLSNQTYKKFETVIVDDGSTDGTSEMITNCFPNVYLLKGNGNLWWAGGINKGIAYALEQGADYILTLNDDTVLPNHFIENMYRQATKYPEAIFGALEKDIHTKKTLYAGQIEKWALDKSEKILSRIGEDDPIGLCEVDTYHGRGLWIPKQVFEKIGLFDTLNFPHYMADFDFVYNAHKHGFEIYCNFDAFLYSYPEACGDKENKVKKNLQNYHKHLFGMKGGGNLTNFTRYTLKHCPTHLIPSRLVLGYSRRLIGYWIN